MLKVEASMNMMKWCPNSYPSATRKITQLHNNLKLFRSTHSPLRSLSTQSLISTHDVQVPSSSPFSGLDETMTGFIFGKKKATEVAHAVWKNVVRKGDLVVDATCGNGHDTLAMARLVADDAGRGRVFAMDLQKSALENTSSLLDGSLTPQKRVINPESALGILSESRALILTDSARVGPQYILWRGLVELYAMCHTKMEDLVPSGASVRLVTFNLGYLPGGDKKIKTESETTLLALEAAKKILARGGLISILGYVGHFGGREEFEKVRSFAAELPVDNWVCCTLQMLNRPSAPVLVLLSRK